MNLIKLCMLTTLFHAFADLNRADAGPIKVGVASRIINNEVGRWVQGAGMERRATAIRDDLEANGIYLSNGTVNLLLVSCDLGGIEPSFNVMLREAMSAASGVPARDILLSSTHTHGGPSMKKSNYLVPIDTAYIVEKLQVELVQLAKQAVQSAQPGKIGWVKDTLQIGFNRRLTWADGTHTMGGDPSRADFTGLEGPDDPQHLGMFACSLKGELLAVLYHNTTHPTIFYGDGIYSADFPGEVRKSLREKLGKKLSVLFLNGAEGDIKMDDLTNPLRENDEEKLSRISRMVVDKTLALYQKVVYDPDPVLRHIYEDLKVGVRLPSAQALTEGKNILNRIDAGERIRGMEMIMAFGAVSLQEKFGEAPFDILPIHAIRIGDLAIVTQPCELFCQFGLDIKRRSPSSSTIVVGLTDGSNGYCPTIYGLLGGGYSGAPIANTRLEPYAGYQIVETASRLLYRLWPQK